MLFAFISTLVLLNNALNWWRIKEFISNRIQIFKEFTKMSNFFAQIENISSKTITFKAGDKNQCHDIFGKNVVITGSVGAHDHGSSKVKLKNIVDYKWETKNYPGHLIAVHLDGKHIAYVIKVNNKISGTEGMVRVANAYSGQRALIKGMSREILDLQFAHIEKEHILACIEDTVLHIHKIDMLSDNLICNLLLKIEDPMQNYVPKYDKISWCPYVPDDSSDDDDDISQIIVWARGGRFQCFNINIIISNNGIGTHRAENITDGYLQLSDNAVVITWAALSPDGTTLCVGSEDGYIRFYQVYFHEKEPRCLHQWNPHDGKAISSFFFLDNLTKTTTDAYWKYALTAAERNTELKIWDCGIWECLQTISFTSPENKTNSFIAEIDRTSSYLVLSNLESRGLYVFQIINDIIEDIDASESDSGVVYPRLSATVFLKSVSEFPLSSPILSFSIVDAAVRKYKCALSDSYLIDELDDYDEENNALYCVVVRMFIVQPKSVQECHILYQATLSDVTEVKSTISNESSDDFKDDLNSISASCKSSVAQEKNKSDVINKMLLETNKSISPPQKLTSSSEKVNKISSSSSRSSSLGHKNFSQMNLMTPESFSSSGKKTPECVSSEVLSTILMLASVTGSTPSSSKTTENINLLNLVNNKMIEDQEHQKFKQSMSSQKTFISSEGNSNSRINSEILASGGSSPSREVQEILSLKDYSKEVTNYFDNTDEQATDNIEKNIQVKQVISGVKNNGDDEKSFKKEDSLDRTENLMEWPKVPDVPNVTKHSVEMQNSSNLISTADNSKLNDLNLKINRLIDVIQLQSSQISELKNEVIEMKKNKQESGVSVKELAYKVEMQLSKLLEAYLIRYEKEHKQKLDNFLSNKDVQNRELLDSMLHMLNQFLFNQFTEKLSNLLIVEIQRHVMPVLVAKLDIIKQQIQSEVVQKLTTTDKVLKENIAQVCKSKSIIDAFGNSVLLGVQNGLQATYVESMTNTLIPAYEKSSQEMFKQLNDTFSLGIKDVMEQFESYLSQLQPVQETTDEILEKTIEVTKYVDSVCKQRSNSNDVLTEMRKEIRAFENNVGKTLSEVIQSEIRKSFESQAASLEDSVLSVVRSQAHTPAPSLYDIQDQIKHLLSQGQINKAFHQALLANDLSLVEYTLEKADYRTVFNPCVLEQTVLLSLIQQISADMNNHNDIKQRYLSDGILNLNQSDPITKEHAPKVIRELYRNCQCFLATNPKSPLCSNVRMIIMAVQGMGYKIF